MTRRRAPVRAHCKGKDGNCRRPLSAPKSVALEYGPDCWEREHPDLILVRRKATPPPPVRPVTPREDSPDQLSLFDRAEAA